MHIRPGVIILWLIPGMKQFGKDAHNPLFPNKSSDCYNRFVGYLIFKNEKFPIVTEGDQI